MPGMTWRVLFARQRCGEIRTTAVSGNEMTLNQKDFASGTLFVLLGLGALWVNGAYRFGQTSDIGPGFFPTSLSLILVGIGLATIARAFFVTPEKIPRMNWRSMVATISAVVVFGFALRPLGLVPAVILLSCISQTASDDVSVTSVVVTAILLSIGAALIFCYGLGVPIQPLGTFFH